MTPADTARPTLVEVPLRWSDMDAYAHVNNVQFLRLLEDARVLGFGVWFGTSAMLDRGVVVSRHEIEYRRPLVYRRAPVTVALWTRAITPVGFSIGYLLADGPDALDSPYAVAETGLVLYDFETERPRRLSAQERAALEPYQGGDVPFRWSR